MLAIVHACAIVGLEGTLIEVQVDFNPKAGIPSFAIVGLPDSAVRESRERVRAAIKNSGLRFPNKGYVVNLSPADLPKHGPSYDLAIAMGVLAATDQAPTAVQEAVFLGELSLDGRVRHVKGVLPMVYAAQQAGYKTIYVPVEDAPQAALVRGIDVIPVASLGELNEHIYGLNVIEPCQPEQIDLDNLPLPDDITDFASVRGQEHVKRALEVACAGNHNIRMVGPPGVGKSLLARALPGILPPLSLDEALEVTRIYSVADLLSLDTPLIRYRPFQSPHHTISAAGLVGGGTIPRPGSISLSHRGVLFLDEINEFGQHVLEVMRQPLEDKAVTIARAKSTVTFPANFLLVAAHNPCPCGYYGDLVRGCTCSSGAIRRYQSKLSGPLLDRIDIHITVPRVDYDKLMSRETGEPSVNVRKRIQIAREIQQERFEAYPEIFANGDMGAGEVQQFCQLKPDAEQLLQLSVRRMHLSARSYHRVLKLSRSIADLASSEQIEVPHVAEALQYRPQQDDL